MVRAIILTSLFTVGAYAARILEEEAHKPSLVAMRESFAPKVSVGQRGMSQQYAAQPFATPRTPVVGTPMMAHQNAPATGAAATSFPASSAGATPGSWREALSSKAMSTLRSTDSMQEIATAALDSHGDVSKLAAFMINASPRDKARIEAMKEDVTEMAQTMPGVTGPLGFFDPLGFCTDCSEGKLCFYREVELKHGRVTMLASLGFLVGENFHPLFGGDIDAPSYLAFQQTPLQTFWPAVVAAIAIPEMYSVFTFAEPFDGGERWSMRTDREPGDFGFDPLGLKPEDPDELFELQNKELNNGRLAMIGAAGMIAQELVSGTKIF